MLQLSTNLRPRIEDEQRTGGSTLGETLDVIVGLIRRRSKLMLALWLIVMALGVTYAFVAPKKYLSTASVVIDNHLLPDFAQQSNYTDSSVDPALVLTEMELVKSDNVSNRVIDQLKLVDDPEFASPSSMLGSILSLMRTAPDGPLSAEEVRNKVLNTFKALETVERVGLTYVMQISFESADRQKAAQIATAIANAYIAEKLDAKKDASRSGSAWLQDRIKELGQQAVAADRAVVDFRLKSGITTVDATGKSMSEQQLSEVNSQLIAAEGASAEAKAKLDRINAVLSGDVIGASVADASNSEVINKLRSQYLDLAGREAIWAAKYGNSHLATINLINQMDQLRNSIKDEMKKIAEVYRSNYAIAEAQRQAINTSLEASLAKMQKSDSAGVRLRELESTSQTSKQIYDNFLQRYMKGIQQESFPMTEARIISPAVSPSKPYKPNILLTVVIAALLGVIASFAAALLRDLRDNVFRTSPQILQHLQVRCLGMVPFIKLARSASRHSPIPSTLRSLPTEPSLFRYALTNNKTLFAQTLKALKVEIDYQCADGGKVIGITSSLADEGKSLLSANLAQILAGAGNRVLLVDADMQSASLSRNLAGEQEVGLYEAIVGSHGLADVVWVDHVTNLQFVPAGRITSLDHVDQLFTSKRAIELFAGCSRAFDYVIVDLAPLAPVVDSRVAASFIDRYLFVVEWGKTEFVEAERVLAEAPVVFEKLLGALLSKVDMARVGRYERSRTQQSNARYLAERAF